MKRKSNVKWVLYNRESNTFYDGHNDGATDPGGAVMFDTRADACELKIASDSVRKIHVYAELL